MKNITELGLDKFIQSFYKDLCEDTAQGWWRERGGRNADSINVVFKDKQFKDVYSLVEFIKENYKDIEQDSIQELCDTLTKDYYLLSVKRVYTWEVSDDKVEEQQSSQERDKTVPDFNYAKSLNPDKQALKDYAEKYGIEVDSRKSFKNMIMSFQGKYHSTKSRK